MTYEELLRKVSVNSWVSPKPLLAIIELHQPDILHGDISCCLSRCQYFEPNHGSGGDWHLYAYPCPTIELIEEKIANG